MLYAYLRFINNRNIIKIKNIKIKNIKIKIFHEISQKFFEISRGKYLSFDI